MEGLLEIKRAESRDLQLLLAAAASWLRSGLRLSCALSDHLQRWSAWVGLLQNFVTFSQFKLTVSKADAEEWTIPVVCCLIW